MKNLALFGTGDRLMGKLAERAIMASTNGIMIVEAGAGRLTTVYVNPAFEVLTGYSSAEVVDAPPGRLHENDREQAGLDELRQAIAAQRATKVVLRNYRKDGKLFWNELSISPVLDAEGRVTHYIGILNDIGDQKHAEQELMTWAMRLDALTTMSAEGLVSFDEKGHLSYVNDAFLRLSGLSAAEVRGIQSADFDEIFGRQCDPNYPCRGTSEDLADLRESGCIMIREVELHLLQPQKRILLRMSKKGNHGTSLLLYYQDVTKARELEELKSEFLATAAHELRTPMASILGYTELLLLRNFDAEQRRELLEIILRQGRRVTDLLNELLDLARIEARRGKDFNFIVQDLREIVRGVAEVSDTSAVRVLVEMPDEPLNVRVDKEKIHQALLNVVSNALKFSPADKPVTLAICRKVGEGAGKIGVAVTDQGIGMTSEQMVRLGERFFRADVSGKVPGTGLGVSLTKEIVELHGGEVEVSSEFGKGSRFALWLPLALPAQSRPGESTRTPNELPSTTTGETEP